MALTEADLEEVRQLVQAGIAASVAQVPRCSIDNPHDTMVYQRGPNVYHCRCGQNYRKDGQGGLMEVT